MPEVTYTGGGHYRVDGYGFDPGTTHDVDEELASYLEGHDDFDVDGHTEGESEDDASAGDTSGDEDSTDGDGFDPETFVDRTPMDDVIEDIHAGDADDHLDAVANAASRVGIEDAVGERRAELED